MRDGREKVAAWLAVVLAAAAVGVFGAVVGRSDGVVMALAVAVGAQVALAALAVGYGAGAVAVAVGAGFLVRWLVAVLTEFHPIFPDYYFSDARKYEALAQRLVEYGFFDPWVLAGESVGHGNYSRLVAVVFWLAGPAPAVMKVVNALAGGLTVWAYGRVAEVLFGRTAAVRVAWLLALWPSAVFWSAQNFRDSPIGLFIALGLVGVCGFVSRRAPRHLALACGAVLLAGLLRPYVAVLFVIVTGVWLVSASPLGAWRMGRLLAGALLLAVLFHPPGLVPDWVPTLEALSPERLSSIRNEIIAADMSEREIATALFYGQEFSSWWDAMTAFPVMMFHVVFMPLPGLYPIEGNLGRLLAAVENLALLVAFLMALPVVLASLREPVARYLVLFLACFVGAYAFVEPDLGSAMRHKPQYFAVVLVFLAGASWEAAARLLGIPVGRVEWVGRSR